MIIFNEYAFATEALNPPKQRVYNAQQAVVIAKHLQKNVPEALLRSTLVHILTLANPSFNPTTRYNLLNTALANAHLPLRTCEPIQISQEDLDILAPLSPEAQRILFTMLVICRFNRANPPVTLKEQHPYTNDRLICTTPLSEIFKLAKLSKKKWLEPVYVELRPLLELSIKKNHHPRQVLPFEPLPEPPFVLTVHDFDNAVQYLLSLADPTVKECIRCHKIFISKTLLVCPSCRATPTRIGFCKDCGVTYTQTKGPQTRCEKCQKKSRYIAKNLSNMTSRADPSHPSKP